jgi:hypothetical protein
MDLPAAMGVGTGLILMYLVLSLLVTAINELIVQFSALRAKHLQSALRHMLNLKAKPEDADNNKLSNAFLNSSTSRIAGLVSKTKWTGANPSFSYMKRETFIACFREAIPCLDSITTRDANDNQIDFDRDLGSLINALPASQLKSTLKAAIGDDAASLNPQDIEKRVGDWFDGMMERATGSFKRWMSTLSLLIGFVLAITFNCDTLLVADHLAKMDPKSIENVAKAVTQDCAGADGTLDLTNAKCKDAKKITETLQKLSIGGGEGRSLHASIFGWLITGVAVSLGAPFWFDLLSKMMNVRSGKKEEKST